MSSQKQILIATGIYPPDIGGPATYVPVMADRLRRRGHRVSLIALSDRKVVAGDSTSRFEIRRIVRGGSWPVRAMRFATELRRQSRDADVLLVSGMFPDILLSAPLLRVPTVYKIVADWVWELAAHRGWTCESVSDLQRGWHGVRIHTLRALQSRALRHADAVIVPSRYLSDLVRGWGVDARRVSTIPNGVDVPAGIEVAAPARRGFNLVTVSRLIPCKRIDRLIDAVAALNDVGLTIVGDGPERPRLEQRAERQGCRQRIHFTGACDHIQALRWMAAGDLFALLSTHEGFPHVILEAMALGVPVLATDVGGASEIVSHGENGFLLDEAELSSLPDVLRRLSAEPEPRIEVARCARETAGRFGVERMVSETEALLLRVARSSLTGSMRSPAAIAEEASR